MSLCKCDQCEDKSCDGDGGGWIDDNNWIGCNECGQDHENWEDPKIAEADYRRDAAKDGEAVRYIGDD